MPSPCPTTESAFHWTVNYIIAFLTITSFTALITNSLFVAAIFKCHVLDASVRAYLLIIAVSSMCSAPIFAGDAIYTLINIWTENVCQLQTTQLSCGFRMGSAIAISCVGAFSLTALSIDRYRDTRRMLDNVKHINEDRPPYKILGCIVVASALLVVMLMGNLVFMGTTDLVIPVCTLSIIMDSPFLGPAMAPTICMHTMNALAMSYVSRTNARVYSEFVSKQAHQTLEYRTRLKRNMTTGRALVPIIRIVTACYCMIATIFCVPLFLQSTLFVKHINGHLMNAIFVTLNTYIAVAVLRTHDDIKAALLRLIPGMRLFCTASVEPEGELRREVEMEVENEKENGVKASYEGAVYNNILNKAWG